MAVTFKSKGHLFDSIDKQKEAWDNLLGFFISFDRFYTSPFRPDNNPSCYFEIYNGKIYFVDYYFPYPECKIDIYNAFDKLKGKLYKTDIGPKRETPKQIDVDVKKFSKIDLNYWLQYGITKKLLEYHNVKSVRRLYLNNSLSRRESLCFAYQFDTRYKIYQPYSEKFKWLSSLRREDVFGLEQLEFDSSQTLIITSSLKDLLCLKELGHKYVIAPQSESMGLQTVLVNNLKKLFDNIIIWFDNDVPGINNAKKLSKQHNLDYYIHSVEPKDVSDIYLTYGKDDAKNALYSCLEKLPF